MEKAVFLDKDGTLIVDIPFNVEPSKIVLSDDCLEGLRRLQQKGYLLIIITNQSGIGRGYFKESALQTVHHYLDAVLNSNDIRLSGFYYCPHYPGGTHPTLSIQCDCRKPLPGMLMRAAVDLNIDLNNSWMIGDILNDVEAGNRAGCKSILIDNGNETEWEMNEHRQATYIAKNINEAAELIIMYNG